jgi:hypothetical protein
VPHSEGQPISEPPDSFSLYSVEEEKNTREETQQPSISRDPEFFLNVNFPEPHKITHKELPGIITDLQLSKNEVELLSSGPHCESESISLPPKGF